MTPILTVSNQEFISRLGRVQDELKRRNLDGLLAYGTEQHPENVRYLSNYWPAFESAAVLVPREGEATLLIGPECETLARAQSTIKNIRQVIECKLPTAPDYRGIRLDRLSDVLKDSIGKSDVIRLAVTQLEILPASFYLNLVSVLGPKAEIVDDTEILVNLRSVKSSAEILLHRNSAAILDQALEKTMHLIVPGMTETEIAGIAEAQVLLLGAEDTGYPGWCATGHNSLHPIHRRTDQVVKEGVLSQIGLGATVQGYVGSISRPFVFGKPTEQSRRLADDALATFNYVLGLLGPGVNSVDVAKKASRFTDAKGYDPIYGPAHSTGFIECEQPWIQDSNEFTLLPGMVFNIDIWLPKDGLGVRFEDTVLITERGAEALSNSMRELIVI